MRMYAYPDSKCAWGYMCVCDICKKNVPSHVDLTKPLEEPLAAGKRQGCEICGYEYVLLKAGQNEPSILFEDAQKRAENGEW